MNTKSAIDYVAAPAGEVYWRYEKCPHRGSKVLLLTIGGMCVTGDWYGELGDAFVAWSPMPKEGRPPRLEPLPFNRRDHGSYTDNQLKYIQLGWSAYAKKLMEMINGA